MSSSGARLPSLSLLCPPCEFGPPMRQWATTGGAPHVCVDTHTSGANVVHFFVIWLSVLLLGLWRITHNTITQACVKLPFGEKTRLRRVLWRLWYFNNKTRSGGYLGHGWEGIGERNFGFDSLKSSGSGLWRETMSGNYPFLLHVAVQSGYQAFNMSSSNWRDSEIRELLIKWEKVMQLH